MKGLNLYYIFNNRRFSYPAAFSQSTNQRRSAGSFIIGFSVSAHNLDFDHFVKYCIIYNQHGNVVWHHVCFGHGNNRKKEFCNDARLKWNVG